MKGILLLNGEPYLGDICGQNALVYCCDGAYKWAKGKVKIDKNIGDFDSLNEIPYPAPDEIYPAEKNFTDGELAMRKLIEAGCDSVEIYGGGGGREDHFMGNLNLCYLAHIRGVKCKMITNRSIIFAAEGRCSLSRYKNKTISVLPFGDAVHIMDSKGLKYAYPEKLSLGECRGISNIVTGDAEINFGGIALIIVNRGEV